MRQLILLDQYFQLDQSVPLHLTHQLLQLRLLHRAHQSDL
jgi:hypothetical protein